MPQKRFDLAEAPPLVARDGGFDGASLDGFMLALGFYFDQPFNTVFFGHEVSHQWWGGLVRRVGPNGAYILDESLAQLGSMLAVERIEGAAAAELYRRRGFPGYYAEYSAFMYLARSLAGIDAALTALPIADGFVSRRIANTKGMLVWGMVADIAGPNRFYAFLRDFIRRHAYRRATLDDITEGLRALLGSDDAFVDDWFGGTGVPDLSLEWDYSDGGVRGIVRQTGRPRRLQAPIEVRCGNGRVLHRAVLVRSSESKFKVRARDVSEVVLDPHYKVLRWTPEYRREAEAIAPFIKGDIELNYGRIEEARAAFEAEASGPPSKDSFGLNALLQRGLGEVAAAEKRYDEAIGHFISALGTTPQWPYQLPEVWRALADAYRARGDTELAAEASANGIRAIAQLLQRGPERLSIPPSNRRK